MTLRCISGLILLAAATANASNTWLASSGAWSTATNWSSGIPTPGTTVEFRNGGSAWIRPGASISIGPLAVGFGGLSIVGSSLSTSSTTLGDIPGSNGQITLAKGTGASQWTVGGSLIVGALGHGGINVQSATLITPSGVTLGQSSGSSGIVTLTGSGSAPAVWNFPVSAPLVVGDAGSASITLVARGMFMGSGSTLTLGNLPTGNGSILVDGRESVWRASSQKIILGNQGTGSISVRNGALAYASELTLAAQPDGSGSLLLTGKGSSWQNGATFVGRTGKGTLRVEKGASMRSSFTTVGDQRGIGDITVTGRDSRWFSGETTVTNGSITLDDNAFSDARIALKSPAATIGFGDNVAFLGSITGSPSGVVNFLNTLPLTFSPSLSGSLTVNVLGGGTVTLDPPAIYSGPTSVTRGTLILNGATIGNTENPATASPIRVDGDGVLAGVGGMISTIVLGGTISPGDPDLPAQAIATFRAGDATWNAGATYLWQLRDATSPDPTGGWDRVLLGQSLIVAANPTAPFRLKIATLGPDGEGEAMNFDPARSYSWIIAAADGGITGFDPADIVIDAKSFENSHDGDFHVEQIGQELHLVYAPLPPPTPPIRPTVTVNLKSETITHSARCAIHGSATAAAPVRVQAQINDRPPALLRSAEKWTLQVTLKPGRNVIQFQAIDATGAYSPVKKITIIYRPK